MNVYGCNSGISDIHGNNFQNNRNSIVNTTDLTLKQSSTYLRNWCRNKRRSQVWRRLVGRIIHGNISLIGHERIINLQRTKVYVFSDSVLCLGKIHQNPESNTAWKKRIEWITSSQSYRNFDGINGEPTEFEWNIFPGLDTLQLCDKVKSLLSRLGETPENFTGRILFMSMFNDISCDGKAIKKNVWQMSKSSPYLQKSLVLDNGHLLVQVPRRSDILRKRIAHKEFGIISRTGCCWNWQKAGVQFSLLRLHCPEVNSKAKDIVNCRFTLRPFRKQLRLFFA